MTTPHIARLLKELETIAAADYKKWGMPHATAADFVTWAKSRARHIINEVSAAIALAEANARQATQEQYITAEQARALGAGNAEWLTSKGNWCMCGATDFLSLSIGGEVIKYRAIQPQAQPEPVEPMVLRSDFDFCMQDKQNAIKLIEEAYKLICEDKLREARELLEKRVNNLTVNIPPFIEPAATTCTRSHPHELMTAECEALTVIARDNNEKRCAELRAVEPHAELKALYAQQVKEGTLDNYVWWFRNGMVEWLSIKTDLGIFHACNEYRCTPKPTCQVRNDDTGELKTMTRESANLLQAETKDTCNWFLNGSTDLNCGFLFENAGIYTYKLKANLVKLDGELLTREAAIAEWESKKDTCGLWYGNFTGHFFKTNDIDFQPNSNVFVSEYQLRPKVLKPVSWADMPVGVAVRDKTTDVIWLSQGAEGAEVLVTNHPKNPFGTRFITKDCIELAIASEQPWMPVFAPHVGLIVEYSRYVECLRVIGIAEGWVLK